MSNLNPKDKQINIDLQDWIEALENLNLFDGEEHAKNTVNEFFKYAQNKGYIDDFFTQIIDVTQHQFLFYFILFYFILFY